MSALLLAFCLQFASGVQVFASDIQTIFLLASDDHGQSWRRVG